MPTTNVMEEGVSITAFGLDISKDLKVFYNPVMKLHRDMSILVLKSYFDKKISFCDPMIASGIRELRYQKVIPEVFNSLVLGDISKDAIKHAKKNFKKNKLSTKNISFRNEHGFNTLSSQYFNCIEVDPFGTPVPFLDIALQRIKHEGLLCVTATDTAALCGTYPNKALRRYGIKVALTLWHEELGLRNLIAYCQRQAAKYEKRIIPIISYSQDHYYRIFFKVEEGRSKALSMVKNLKWIEYDKKTQDISLEEFEQKRALGKTYVGPLCDKKLLEKIKENIGLLEKPKRAEKLIDKLLEEIEVVGYYNSHKLQKAFKIGSDISFENLIETLKDKGFNTSRVHNNPLGIKTTATSKELLQLLRSTK